MKLSPGTIALAAALAIGAAPAFAKVKLVLMPQRENVRAHYEQGGNALMEEERVVALEEGVNQVELAWEGLPILPQSILFDPVGAQEKPTTLAVSTPPSGQSALIWWVKATTAGNYRLRITYALAGGWGAGLALERVDYTARADLEETGLDLSGRVRVLNGSGMDQNDVSVEIASAKPTTISLDRDERRDLLILQDVKYPILKRFLSDAQTEGGRVQLLYEWKVPEDAAAQLAGKARAFLATAGEGGQLDTFLGESRLDYAPRGEDAKLFVGFANNIEVERILTSARDENIRWTKVPPNTNWSPERVLWDTVRDWTIKVKNHTNKEVVVRLAEHAVGQWEIAGETKPTEIKNASLLYFDVTVPANGETELTYTIVQRNIEPNDQTL